MAVGDEFSASNYLCVRPSTKEFRMKISFVVQDLVGQGVQYATAIIAREFARCGWDVEILVSPVHDDKIAQGGKSFELPDSIKLSYMPNRRGSRNGWFMRKYLKTCGSDFVIAESGIYSWCIRWASLGIAKKNLPKLVQVVHGNEYMLSGWALLKYRIKSWFHYRNFTALFFVNLQSELNFRAMCGFLKKLRIGTVNNACIDSVANSKYKLSPQHPWLVKKECCTLVTAGSYTPGKCHLMLLEAMRRVVAERRVRLLIFGRGYLEPQYHDFIAKYGLEDSVSIAGFTDQLQAEIKASDGLISPSDYESFGITLVEALACGKPVISTDALYGPREILADGKFGRLVPVNDSAAMAQAIIDCADGKIPVAPDESWKRYTIEAIMEKYLNGIGVI